MSEKLESLKNDIATLRGEIAHLENTQAVRAQHLTTEEFAAFSAELEGKRKALAKLTKKAAAALKLKKPSRI